MSYSGNASLSSDIRKRVLTTFEQALDLADAGSRQEAMLGCDFILRLDPLFEPARVLRSRLQEDDGRPLTEDLRPHAREAEEGEPPPGTAVPDSAPTPAPTADAEALQEELLELLERRDFQQLLEIAAEQEEVVAADPGLRSLVSSARTRLEAEPYVKGFLESARLALQEGDDEQAESFLKKARALDASHPGIAELRRALRGEEPAAAPREAPEAAAEEAGRAESAEEILAATEELLRETRLSEPQEAQAGEEAEEAAEDELVVDFSRLDPGREAAGQERAPEGRELGQDDALSGLESLSLEEEGVAAGDEDEEPGDERIQDLLEEGQKAFDGGEYQAAIDAWSRIFLIDIDHEEAGRRIEEARRLKAEHERRVEEIFHEASGHLDEGRTGEAREALERVLELQPSHLAARQALDRLEVVERPPEAPPATAAGEEPEAADRVPLEEEIFVPPDTGAERPPAPVSPAPRPAPRRRMAIYLGLVLLLVVVAATWLLYVNRGEMFPNAQEAAAPPATALPGPVERAQTLHAEGKTPAAVALLRRIPPSSPHYAEAQTLIAQWEAPAPLTEPEVVEASPEAMEHRQRLLGAAREAMAQGENLAADERFAAAAQIAPLEEESRSRWGEAQAALEPLAPQIELFRGGEWEYALRDLWRIYEQNPRNRDVQRLIVDSYYNLGVRELQRHKPDAAVDSFQEALELRPEDEELQRLYLFSQTYERRSTDLLYRIFVKYLPFRGR